MSWLDCSDCHAGPQNKADKDYLNQVLQGTNIENVSTEISSASNNSSGLILLSKTFILAASNSLITLYLVMPAKNVPVGLGVNTLPFLTINKFATVNSATKPSWSQITQLS